MNTTEKLIEVKFNKKVWKKTKINLAEKTMLFVTMMAFIFLMESLIAMVEQWSISDTPLILSLICLGWFGIFALYLFIVNR